MTPEISSGKGTLSRKVGKRKKKKLVGKGKGGLVVLKKAAAPGA